MRYIVRGGREVASGVRIAAADAVEALRIAGSMADQGVRNVNVISDDHLGQPLTLAAFSRSIIGHSLSHEQVEIIGSTWQVVANAGAGLADEFYSRLFQIAPAARALFADDLTSQKRKLTDTLASMVDQIAQPEDFVASVVGLARRHVGYGAKPEHYPAVGEALLHSLGMLLGPKFTDGAREAWATLYSDLTAAMLTAVEDSRPTSD